MFVFFGCSSVAQYKLLNRAQNDSASFLLVNAGFGFGILAAILTVGKVSGKKNKIKLLLLFDSK